MKKFLLKLFSGFFSFLGEILIFVGIYFMFKFAIFKILAMGLLFLIIGQLTSVNTLKYEDKRLILWFKMQGFELIGREFVYPVVLGVLFFLTHSSLFSYAALSLGLIALIKSVFILYKLTLVSV